jgi:DNA topoisomerase I
MTSTSGGHLFDLPTNLTDVGIDRHLNEVGRRPKKQQQIAQIQQWAKRAQRVMIACDADQEGDVLAWDIAMLLEEVNHKNFARVRLRSLDVEGVLHAFMHPEPVRYRDAWAGTARRMIDRLIGATYGQRDVTGVDLSVGRVQSALLGAAAKEQIPYGEATIALPCCDNKEPFVATIPVFEHNFKAVKELIEHAQEFAKAGRCIPFGKAVPAENFKPWGFGEAVLAVSQATDRPIDSVSRSLQRLYEAGRMSYPRSDASAVTAQGLAAAQKMAEQHGVRFDASKVPMFSRHGRHAHESPRPLQSDVNITAPLLVLSDDEAALSLISRHLVACGQPHAVHSPDPSALPGWAQGLQFERKVCQWLRPWPRRPAETGLRIFPKEEIALSLLLKHKLGRPSTMVFHALKFASRDLLGESAQLDPKGADWIKRTPELLRNPKTSQQIERILSACVDDPKYNEAPPQLVKSLLESMNLWGDVQAMLQRVEASQPNAIASGIRGNA